MYDITIIFDYKCGGAILTEVQLHRPLRRKALRIHINRDGISLNAASFESSCFGLSFELPVARRHRAILPEIDSSCRAAFREKKNHA